MLDLPQIYTKPTANSLLDTLSLLGLEPKSWEVIPPLTVSNTPRTLSGSSTPALRSKRRVKADGVPQYLTGIISSPLSWIESDDEKEKVWDTAAVRLSERSGRTGMGAISRTFRILRPTKHMFGGTSLDNEDLQSLEQDAIEIEIHEPSMTADNLGLKTWASSYVLARKWHSMKDILPSFNNDQKESHNHTILELGAGTGLVGLAAAAVLGAKVLLTDLPDIAPNLARNAETNHALASATGGSTRVGVLDWSAPQEVQWLDNTEANNNHQSLSVPVIVAADPIYSSEHPYLLARAIAFHLSPSPLSRVVVEMPIREAYAAERADFRAQMREIGLVVLKEETEIGYDDWEGTEEELVEVECWMSVWGWGV